MKTLYLDCFSGISGNMFVGMLLDGGVPFDAFSEAMKSLGLSGYRLLHEPVNKCGIEATHYNVILEEEERHHHDHHHDHHDDGHHDHHHHDADEHHAHAHHGAVDTAGHHHVHHHRGLKEIREIITSSPLSEKVKTTSLAVFQALGEAEAHVHGVPVESVHFHEVGAIDCILDIVGTVWALEYAGIERVLASPIHTGTGFVRCAHGVMPVPAPATAQLLSGIPCYDTDIQGELVTPTGAALVKTLASYVGTRPAEFIHHTTAYGAGTKDLTIPNVLRGFIGDMV